MRTLLILSTVLLLFCCDNDHELQKSVFIYDKQNPRLPEYSEWGYNTFGAFYDRVAFVSNNDAVPVKVISQNGNTSFVFKGELNSNSNLSPKEFSMSLILHDVDFTSYSDLVSLHQTSFDLTNADYEIDFADGEGSYEVEVTSGTLEIKRAQYLLVDEKPTEVILSGVFELRAVINGSPVAISEGRFDVGVGENNFFVLD